MWPFKKKPVLSGITLIEPVAQTPVSNKMVGQHFEVIGHGFDHERIRYEPGVIYPIDSKPLAALVLAWSQHTKEREAIARYW